MALTPRFDKNDILKKLSQDRERIEAAIIFNLKLVGEQFIIDARSKTFSEEYIKAINSLAYAKGEKRAIIEEATPGFKDHTTNLRSSIGFVILKDGIQILDGFPGTAAHGNEAGKKIAAEAGAKFPKGIVLIVVAGMDYAGYVESKGYDVITGSSFKAETSLKRAMDRIRTKLQ